MLPIPKRIENYDTPEGEELAHRSGEVRGASDDTEAISTTKTKPLPGNAAAATEAKSLNPFEQMGRAFGSVFGTPSAKSDPSANLNEGVGDTLGSMQGNVDVAAEAVQEGDAKVRDRTAGSDKTPVDGAPGVSTNKDEDNQEDDSDLVEEQQRTAAAEEVLSQFFRRQEQEASDRLTSQFEQRLYEMKLELEAQNRANKEELVAQLEVKAAQVEEMRQQLDAVTTGNGKGSAAPSPESTDLRVAVQAMTELAGTMTRLYGESPERKTLFTSPGKGEEPVLPFPFMEASEMKELAGVKTGVSVGDALANKPNRDVKGDMMMAYAQMAEDKLLVSFDDSLTFSGYVEQRVKLVRKLAAMAYTLLEKEGREAAQATVTRHLQQSLEYFATSTGYAKLGVVVAELETAEERVTAVTTLNMLDLQFASASKVGRAREITQQLNELTMANGIVPSAAISKCKLLIKRRLGSTADQELLDSEVRTFITEMIRGQTNSHPCLKPFDDKLLDTEFADQPLSKWQAQFALYEKTPSFQEGLHRAQGTPVVPRAKGKETGSAGARGVNALLGYSPTEVTDTEGNQTAVLQKILSMVAGIPPNDTVKGGGSAGGGDGEGYLARLIAMVEQNVPQALNDAWVKQHGMIGFKAPSASDREQLHVGKICRAIGVEVPKGCPVDPQAYVGFLCPCNQMKGIPEEHWYYAPMSDEFKSGKPEFSRVKPVDVKVFGWMHKLGKCKALRAEAHKKAKEDPAKHIDLLAPLPRGTKDCVTIE